MNASALLIVAVAAVGVLHTMVPDHWAPIALLSRQRGWSPAATARAAAVAGFGHAFSTLVLALIVWTAGALAARRYGGIVGIVSDIALIAFGAWIAVGALREIHDESHHGHAHVGHAHEHRHEDGLRHRHWHEHDAGEADHEHESEPAPEHLDDGDAPPVHTHDHATSGRMALLLILGSSPMVEGIPAFLAATRYGVGQLVAMAVVFAVSTILTYVALVLASARGLQRVNLGPLERYGEVLSGGFIALVGIVLLFLPGL